jgi:hypothetical protein
VGECKAGNNSVCLVFLLLLDVKEMRVTAATTLPWYKHRWPWILMAGPGIVVVASAITLYLALKSNDGLVAEDYYKQGLSINRVLEKDNQARKLGISAHLNFADDRLDVSLKSKQDVPVAIRVTLAHPTRSGLDKTLLLRGMNGRYQGALPELSAGRWLVAVTDEANTWRLSTEMTFPQQQQIELSPPELAKN